MPKTPPAKSTAARKLGALLRAARGSRTQQEIASSVSTSDATLSRFEQGQHVPDLEQAALLDEKLGTGTMVKDAVIDILYNPAPGVLAVPRKFSMFVFEPRHVGPVYVKFTAPVGVVHDVRVLLSWGGKQRLAPNPLIDKDFSFLDPEGFRVDEAGIALVFAKQEPGTVPLRAETSEPLMLGFGLGMPLLDDDRILDANAGWLSWGSHQIPTPPGSGS